MFAVRTLARAAPRITSRSLTTITRRTLTSPLRPVSIRSQLPKYFSTSRPQFDASSQELSAKLESELQLESDEGAQQPALTEEDINGFLARNDWQITDNEGEQIVKLTKKYEDEIITVSFTVQDFQSPPFGEEEDDALLDEDFDAQSGGAKDAAQGRAAAKNDAEETFDDEQGQDSFPATVSVTVSRAGKQDALRFELVADNGELQVQSVTPLPSAEADTIAPGFQEAQKFWAGPAFGQLDDELQTMFEAYLSERGINTDLATFVPDYIDTKEQKEYIGWLKDIKQFLD